MSYIDNNLLAGEKILFRTKKHYIIFFTPAVLLLMTFFLSSSYTIPTTINNTLMIMAKQAPIFKNFHYLAALFLLLVTAYSAITQGIIYLSSDYAVTNTRIIMREGFFNRIVCDMRLYTVANVTVDQNLLAQALNYGTVVINGFGGVGDHFYQIANPVALQNIVNSQLDARTG